MMINGQIDSRKESLQLMDSPQISNSQKKESISVLGYDPEVQDRDKQMEFLIKQLSSDASKQVESQKDQQQDSNKNTPNSTSTPYISNQEQEYKIKVNDIEDTQNGRLLSRLNTYDLRQQFFKNENQYPQHLFLMNSHIAQWGRLQDNIKAQYLFLKQENEVKNQMIEDLKIYQLKMIKNNLKYKFLLKERSRYSMAHDNFQDIRPKMKINIQNFDTSERSLVDTINKNQDLLKSMMLKIAQNPLLLAYIIEQNNQYDNNLDQFLDDVNSLFYERVLVDNQYHNPIYILQAYLIDRELNKAQTPEDVFKISNLSTKTIYAFSKNINCVIFLEKVLYRPLKEILTYSQQFEVNLSKLYDQFKKKPKSRRAAMNFARPSNIESVCEQEASNFSTSVNLLENSKYSSTQINSHTPVHNSKNPITQIKNFFKTYLPIGRNKKCNIEGKRTSTNENIEHQHERSVSTFVLQTGGFLNKVNENTIGRVSLANVPSTGRRERRRKGNQSNGNIISQSSIKEYEDNTIDSDIVNYLKKLVPDMDIYVALDVQIQVNSTLTILASLVKQFMNEILINVRNYPKEINIMCCILKRSLVRRFPLISIEEINSHIRQFVFNKWIFQDLQLINQRNIMSKKEQEYLSKNFHLINHIVQHIVKQQMFEQREFPLCKLNYLIQDYKQELDRFYDILCTAEHTLIDLIIDKSNLENTTFSRSGILTSSTNSLNSSQNSKAFPNIQFNQHQVQDVTSLAFSLEDLRIITLLISKMREKLEKFDARNLLFKEAIRLQEKLKDVFKDNLTSRNSYYFIWEIGTNQSTGYIEKLFQIDYGLTKKEKKELNQQQLHLIKIKEMLVLFLLSIDSILYLMQLKRGQELTLLQILDEYKIKQIDHIINIRQNQQKVQMDIYLEYLQLLLQGLPENLKQGEYESILKDICLTLDRKFSFLTQQILAYKQLYLQKKNIIKGVIQFVKEQQETIIKKNIKQNMLLFIRSSYINIKIITTRQTSTPSKKTANILSFQIIQNEEITVQDTQSIARKKEDMLDEFKVYLEAMIVKQLMKFIINNRMASAAKNQLFVYLLRSKIFLSYKVNNDNIVQNNSFISYLIYTPELSQCIEDRTNLESFNTLISEYLDLLEAKVNELPFYQNMKEDQRNLSFGLIEKYLSKQILEECMPQNNSAQKFSFMSEKHQCVERFLQEENMWDSIAHDLRKINLADSHIEKLNVIFNCWDSMVKVLMMVPGEGTGADDCLPVWIHILLKSSLDRIHTNINFIELMMRKGKTMQNEITFVFTQFQSAVEYIDNLTEEKVLSYLRDPLDIQEFIDHSKKYEFLKNEVEEVILSPLNYQKLQHPNEKKEIHDTFSIN